ncbi:MAG: sigma-54-dependent Fis family transcriptional regulator [Oligoflexia bacterium]|nr:sigma-54-dependent Fis family transcriptional regulator [Oligoflexia bacterium]
MKKKANILVVDDETSIRQSLSAILEDEGFEVFTASNGHQAIDMMAKENFDCVLLDIWMPQYDGLEVLKDAKKRFPLLNFIIMSGHGNIETAVKATKLGAFDFIEKPLSVDKVMIVINNLLTVSKLTEENTRLLNKVKKDVTIVGESEAILNLRQMITRVAPTQSWVLITGENGTGKELVAQNIHYQSARAARNFVEVNCAAIAEDLIESELFGHEKGAFTGAIAQKKGRFDLAHGGTLFLDEIGDMSLKTQAKILRILQEQRFERVGGTNTILVDVRVVAATNKNLEEEIKAGRFREDLFYRLNVIPFRVPSLRERKTDIPLLCEKFLQSFAKESGVKPKALSKEALAQLQKYEWPGNVRELRNFIERLFILTPSDYIEVQDLVLAGFNVKESTSIDGVEKLSKLREARAMFEREFILKKLEENDGNVSKTAELIGLERSHLHRKMKVYGIES